MTPKRNNVTPLQLYQAIKEYDKVHSFSPTLRELGKIVGLTSPSSVQQRLDSLKQMGYIASEPHKARSIKILK